MRAYGMEKVNLHQDMCLDLFQFLFLFVWYLQGCIAMYCIPKRKIINLINIIYQNA